MGEPRWRFFLSSGEIKEVIPDWRHRREARQLKMSGAVLSRICSEYGLDDMMVMMAITPQDDMIAREQLQAAREELAHKLLNIPIDKKTSSGKIGTKAVISYLAAMMVEVIAQTKEPMPPSLAALLCDRLCGPKPELLAAVSADEIEADVLQRASVAFEADEPISIREGAKRLGISEKVMRQLLKRGFEEKLREYRDLRIPTRRALEKFQKRCAQ
jgi:hypothetical protein